MLSNSEQESKDFRGSPTVVPSYSFNRFLLTRLQFLRKVGKDYQTTGDTPNVRNLHILKNIFSVVDGCINPSLGSPH